MSNSLDPDQNVGPDLDPNCLTKSKAYNAITFSKNSFRNIIRVSNSLDPDQAGHFVGPDLGPNCLQRISADNTSR